MAFPIGDDAFPLQDRHSIYSSGVAAVRELERQKTEAAKLAKELRQEAIANLRRIGQAADEVARQASLDLLRIADAEDAK